MYICFNGKLLDKETIQISPLSHTFLYGYGLFETIRVYDGKLYFFKEHMRRIKKGCSILNLELKYNEDTLCKYCNELIKKNKLNNGALRISYSKDISNHTLLIITRQNNYTEDSYKKGFKLCFSQIKRNPHSPIVYLKSNNYLENLLARQRAKDRGFDEAVFLNICEKICEGTISNVFFVKDQRIFTPAIDCGILSGILREKLIEIIKALDLDLCIGQYEREHLQNADEIFITNSLMNIMPISCLEDRKLDIEKNSITKTLMKEIKKLYNG